MKRYIAYLFNNQIVNIMKRNLLLILSIIICNSYAVAAQEIMRNGKAAPDYFSLEVNTFATASNICSASYWETGACFSRRKSPVLLQTDIHRRMSSVRSISELLRNVPAKSSGIMPQVLVHHFQSVNVVVDIRLTETLTQPT